MPVLLMRSAGLPALRCPDGAQKIDYCDQLCKGLVLEVRFTGGRTWYVRFTNARGRRRQLRLGDADVLSLAEARAQAQEHRHSVALGKDPADERDALRLVPTLECFVNETFLPFIKITKKSWKQDLSLLNKHIIPAVGRKYLDAITRDDVLALIQKRIADGASAGSVNRVVILLRFMFNQIIRWNVVGVTSNPTRDIPLLKLNNQRQRFLSEQEASRLLVAVQQSRNPVLGGIVAMLLLTGARKREVMDARWDCIDWSGRIWKIPISKSGVARYVPLSDGALLLLRQRQLQSAKDCLWVFANPESLKPYTCITNAWVTARTRAGLENLRMHDLRHSFASFLVNNGRSLYEVQRILGHSSARMTERYAHLAQDTLLQATNAVSGVLEGSIYSLHQDLEREHKV
jgi:integrase